MKRPRTLICPITESRCIEEDCKRDERCIEREREEAAFRKAQTRERPIIDPVTGKVVGIRTNEDLGL